MTEAGQTLPSGRSGANDRFVSDKQAFISKLNGFR